MTEPNILHELEARFEIQYRVTTHDGYGRPNGFEWRHLAYHYDPSTVHATAVDHLTKHRHVRVIILTSEETNRG